MPEPTVAIKQIMEKIFDEAAISYDRVGPSIFARFGERLVEHMPLAPGARVLDIATGKGAVLLPAARRVGPEGRAIGIDVGVASLITTSDGEKVEHPQFYRNSQRNESDVVYAAALAMYAKARQNQIVAQYNYDYVKGLPNSLDVQTANATLDGLGITTNRPAETFEVAYAAPSLEAITEFAVDTNGFKADQQLFEEYLTSGAHEDNVRHVEMFFDPQGHTARGIAFSTVVGGLHRAIVLRAILLSRTAIPWPFVAVTLGLVGTLLLLWHGGLAWYLARRRIA